ncbi:hypothetical protein T12_3493, partial [Trichinella patagoniensis]
LIAEQSVMGTLIQQVLSGNVTVGDLRRVNKVYAEKQQRSYPGAFSGSINVHNAGADLMPPSKW